ncbi:unnamed protein product [Brassicogethes aeneus]|uniref:UDP-N-acetylglucosamine diphosphorylase n=1 Tax=Brassicogethes aeneus TaxID=1431903 RepID=A0A9P0B2M6_BRAAE|nr:unnamed protein product [Brassicogethes aeneus]
MQPNLAQVKKKLEECEQSHLLKFWEDLDSKDQDEFLKELNEIPLKNINSIYKKAVKTLNNDVKQLNKCIAPIPRDQIQVAKDVTEKLLEKYLEPAYEAISKNKVAVILLAGGQGTRLGVRYPKGMFSVGLPSEKTLFQLQAERIRRVLELANSKKGRIGNICWYIMTSESTDLQTQQYLEEHNFFELKRENIVIFQQGVLPCFDNFGKIILSSKRSIAMAPDGNGGIYRALQKNGILDDMDRRGIEYVHVYGVDNILVKVADPAFLGYCISKKADCGAKVIKKADPAEPVGVICKVDGKIKVVEYSEIDSKLASLRDENGDLLYSAGSICNHFFTTQFLKKIAKNHEEEIPLHVAKKKIVQYNGTFIHPQSPNGIKIEKFIFDVFQFSENFATWEVEVNREFSPLKNAEGKDSPATARRDLLNLHKMFIEKAGAKCESDVEISPLLSYSGENLDKFRGKIFKSRTVIGPSGDIINGDFGI